MGGLFAWQDERSIQEFRHSELYAKLALSPNVLEFRDHVESVVEMASEDLRLAA
ncbi:MAG: hypothetical protein U0837_03660 [Dehalococcoidia bacterium]